MRVLDGYGKNWVREKLIGGGLGRRIHGRRTGYIGEKLTGGRLGRLHGRTK